MCAPTKLLRGMLCFGGNCDDDPPWRDTEAYSRCMHARAHMEPNLQSVKEDLETSLLAHSPEQLHELTGFETGTQRAHQVLQ